MAVCYFEVTDPQGVVNQAADKGPIRVVDDVDLTRLARGILDEYGSPGWTCRVWIQDGIFPFPVGEPAAVVMA